MKFFVYSDDPIVLKNITINNNCTIKVIDGDDGFGEEGEFKVEEGNERFGLNSYICPKCLNSFGSYRRVNYCPICGLKNSAEVEDE